MSVALVIHHAMRVRHIVICGLLGSTIFIHIIKTARFKKKKKLLNIKCVWFPLQLLPETFLSPSTIQRDIILNIFMYSRKVHVAVDRFYQNLKFSRQIFGKKNTQISNFIKIRPVGAELFHADRRTDRHTHTYTHTHKHTGGHDGVNSLFLQFCERSYKY